MPASKKTTPKTTKTATKKVVKEPSTKAVLSVPTYDVKGAKHGTTPLPKGIFGADINKPLMAQAVRIYLANQRQGNAHTQGRSDVKLTKAKVYRQKGTGRARHGAKSAPIFVGGGLAHGPKTKDYSLKFPKKMKKNAIISALSLKAKEGEIKVLTGFTKIDGKTKSMNNALMKINEDKKGKTKSLIIASSKPKDLENLYRASKNIKNLEVLSANLINTYEILKYKNLLIMKESINVIEEMRGKN